ncbi:hypothetical protein [Corallococcus sp. CA049B]|nr:hypothetical protein [Corallococcus sp. CA049B]
MDGRYLYSAIAWAAILDAWGGLGYGLPARPPVAGKPKGTA